MLVVQVQDSSFFPIPCGYRDAEWRGGTIYLTQEKKGWIEFANLMSPPDRFMFCIDAQQPCPGMPERMLLVRPPTGHSHSHCGGSPRWGSAGQRWQRGWGTLLYLQAWMDEGSVRLEAGSWSWSWSCKAAKMASLALVGARRFVLVLLSAVYSIVEYLWYGYVVWLCGMSG